MEARKSCLGTRVAFLGTVMGAKMTTEQLRPMGVAVNSNIYGMAFIGGHIRPFS
jgi:hypothetical protein